MDVGEHHHEWIDLKNFPWTEVLGGQLLAVVNLNVRGAVQLVGQGERIADQEKRYTVWNAVVVNSEPLNWRML